MEEQVILMETLWPILNLAIAVLFTLCYAYQFVYIPIVFFKKPKKFEAVKNHRYAVLVSALNEEQVIGNLIESIRKQDYPSELVDIIIVADNCTDKTAEVARNAGAIVYERFNKEKRGKGYALNYLFGMIEKDFGIEHYDGYFVFDADNLLEPNYITEMNKVFGHGYNVITSYRNSKNYGTNWISAGYSLWFLREAKYLNYPRMLLGTSAAIAGTGFVMSSSLIKKHGGWDYYLLTEDIEFVIDNIIHGETIGYCGEAVFYDEQPHDFKQSWNQRVRWTKGYYQVFHKFGTKMLRGLFTKKGFTFFDMSMIILPAIVLTFLAILVNAVGLIVTLASGASLIPLLLAILELIGNGYLTVFFIGLITTVTEWNNIHCSAPKKILYLFTFPLFMFTYVPIAVAAAVQKVEWKPVKHDITVSIDDINKKK